MYNGGNQDIHSYSKNTTMYGIYIGLIIFIALLFILLVGELLDRKNKKALKCRIIPVNVIFVGKLENVDDSITDVVQYFKTNNSFIDYLT